MRIETAAQYWQAANRQSFAAERNRWLVASKAYRLNGHYQKGAMVELAQAIAQAQGNAFIEDKTPLDTVYRLAHAYALFVMLARLDLRKAKEYRRKYPYTRFTTVFDRFTEYEFEPEKAWDYLDLKGGNRAVAAFIEDAENPSPEWERRSIGIYKQAYKLKDDFGVPDGLQKAAVLFVAEFESWEKGKA